MLPADERRLQREADIARAIRGPDYRLRDLYVNKVKAEVRRRDEIAMDTWRREYAGYLEAVRRREVQFDDMGNPYPFRPAPGSRVR